jgi:hypothetical protein
VKKLLLLAAVAAGVGYLVKFKSEQVKTAAAKVTRDPRVQSALATASDKAGPYAATVGSAVADRLHPAAPAEDLTPPAVPEEAADEVAATDPVSAPEFTAGEFRASEPPKVESADIEPLREAAPDPLTDPIETLQDIDAPEGTEK